MCMMPRTWTLSKRRTGGAIAVMNEPFARNSSHAFRPTVLILLQTGTVPGDHGLAVSHKAGRSFFPASRHCSKSGSRCRAQHDGWRVNHVRLLREMPEILGSI